MCENISSVTKTQYHNREEILDGIAANVQAEYSQMLKSMDNCGQ